MVECIVQSTNGLEEIKTGLLQKNEMQSRMVDRRVAISNLFIQDLHKFAHLQSSI